MQSERTQGICVDFVIEEEEEEEKKKRPCNDFSHSLVVVT